MDDDARVQYVTELKRLRGLIEGAPNITTVGIFEWDGFQATPENPHQQVVDEIIPLDDALAFIELDANVSCVRYSDSSPWLRPRPMLDNAGQPICEAVRNAAGEPIQIEGKPVWSEKSTPPRDRGVLLLTPPPTTPLDNVLQGAASLGGPTYCSVTAETEALIEVMRRGGKLLSKPSVAPLVWQDGALVAEATPPVVWASLIFTLSERGELFDRYSNGWWHWNRDPIGPVGLGSVSKVSTDLMVEQPQLTGGFDSHRQGVVIQSFSLASTEAIDWLIRRLEHGAVALQQHDGGTSTWASNEKNSREGSRVGLQQEVQDLLDYTKQFELTTSEKTQLQKGWPWLDWEEGKLRYVLSSDGKLCLPIRDGAEVPAAFLPDVIQNGGTRCISRGAASLASYRVIADRPQRDMNADARRAIDQIYASIIDIDNPDPIPKQILLKQPELAAWLNGELPRYAPTRFEHGLLWPAFIERRRKLRERSLSGISHVEVTPTDAAQGWSRWMTKTEAGRLLGGPSSDKGCRNHLKTLLIDYEDRMQEQSGGKKVRFCLAWIKSIEPNLVAKFRLS